MMAVELIFTAPDGTAVPVRMPSEEQARILLDDPRYRRAHLPAPVDPAPPDPALPPPDEPPSP